MKRFLVVWVILLFLGSSIPTLALSNERMVPLSSGNILYVGGTGPGNYTRIQSAIDNASDGFIIRVYPKQYNENVRMNKQLFLEGININGSIPDIYGGDDASPIYVDNDTCTIENFSLWNGDAGGGQSAIRIYANDTSVKNCTMYHTGCGIFCQGYSDNLFRDNEIIGLSHRGIDLVSSNNNSIINNNIYNHLDQALYLRKSSGNWIYQNIFNDSRLVEVEDDSKDNIFEENHFLGMRDGFCLENAEGTVIHDNIIDVNLSLSGYLNILLSLTIENNLAHGEPIFYYKNLTGIVVSEISGEIFLVNCSNSIIDNCQVTGQGIHLFYTSNSSITNNSDITLIQLCNSSDNLIAGNSLLDTRGGISLSNSNRNLVHQNIIENKIVGNGLGTAIRLNGKSNLIDCNYINNCEQGIYLTGWYTIISNNTIDNCSNYGILDYSSNSFIQHNFFHYGAIAIAPGHYSIVSENFATKSHSGIFIFGTLNYTVTNNTLLQCGNGITVQHAKDGLICSNHIEGGRTGIVLAYGTNFIIERNNIIRNKIQAAFLITAYKQNTWENNYWGTLPKGIKHIIGLREIILFQGDYSSFIIRVPSLDSDSSPAKEPYDIPTMN
jgi:nitrous oxidase accessory protein